MAKSISASILLSTSCLLLLNGCALDLIRPNVTAAEYVEQHKYKQALAKLLTEQNALVVSLNKPMPTQNLYSPPSMRDSWPYATDYEIIKADFLAKRANDVKRADRLKALLKDINSKSDQYRKKLISVLNKETQRSKWYEASVTAAQLNENVPPHPSIEKSLHRYHVKQAQAQRKVDTKVAIAQAHYLIEKEKEFHFHYGKNTQVLPHERKQLAAEKKALADRLLELSAAAIEVQDYHQAEASYEVALVLDQNSVAPDHGKAITNGLAQKTQKTIRQRQKKLLREMNAALRNKEFSEIKKLEKILSHSPFQGQAVKETLLKAEKLISSTAIGLDKRADKVYRQGKIQEAIQLWERSQALFPHLPGVKDKLQRAIKVKSKLDKLRNG